MNDCEKKSDVFYITHRGELLIWLIILLVVVAVSTIFIINNEKNNNDHSLLLPDVDGLIVGSPVRMMGIEIGHITKIKPMKDEVFVKFLIKDENIKIPQGTQATVEFSGMAGSKSLELYPPTERTYIDSSVPLITVNPPKRLHEAVGLLNEMFQKLGSIITTTSLFGKKLKTIDMPGTGNPEDFKSFIKYADNTLDNAIKRAEDFEKRIKKYGK